MFDAHLHLQFADFDADRAAVLARARDVGVRAMAVAGYDLGDLDALTRLARLPGVLVSPGLHPWALPEDTTSGWIDQQLKALDQALSSDTLWCAVGECGLDYHVAREEGARRMQERAFLGQLELARRRGLPVVVHAVRCHDALHGLLARVGVPPRGLMLHGYSGNSQQLERLLGLGAQVMVSLGTDVINQDGRRIRAVCRAAPADRLLIETDAPSRPPRPRDTGRSEPAFLVDVARAVARARGEDWRALAAACEANARRFFGAEEGG